MKRYKDYMDNLEVSDTLHQRLTELEAPKKRPAAWRKYGAAAAALILVAGVGAWGLSQSQGGWGALMENFKPNGDWGTLIDHFNPAVEVAPEIADIPVPDIATEDPGHVTEPGMKTNGGYEVVHGDKNDPNTMVSYYFLPYLDWADASTQPQTALNYLLAPHDAIQRDATWDDVLMFTGGEKAMFNHLLWDEGMNWSGTVWFLEDGTPCSAELGTGYTNRAYGMRLYLEVRKDHEVPSCVVLPDEYYETSQWQGVKITALKNAGYAVEDGVKLDQWVVSLYSNGVGYKLTVYAVDAERADEICARFVRYAVDGGFRLDALSADGAVGRSGFSVGEPNWEDGVPDEDSDCPYCADGTAHTHPYDPSAPN